MGKRMGRMAGRAALCLGLAAAQAGCLAEDAAGPEGTGTNVPAIGITAQGFAFSVLADGFTFEHTYASPTQGDSLDIGLAVTSYGGGSALIEVADAHGVSRYAQTVTTNLVLGQVVPGGTPPYTVHLRLTAFTGAVALGVSARGS